MAEANGTEILRVDPIAKAAFELVMTERKIAEGKALSQREVFRHIMDEHYPEYVDRVQRLQTESITE